MARQASPIISRAGDRSTARAGHSGSWTSAGGSSLPLELPRLFRRFPGSARDRRHPVYRRLWEVLGVRTGAPPLRTCPIRIGARSSKSWRKPNRGSRRGGQNDPRFRLLRVFSPQTPDKGRPFITATVPTILRRIAKCSWRVSSRDAYASRSSASRTSCMARKHNTSWGMTSPGERSRPG